VIEAPQRRVRRQGNAEGRAYGKVKPKTMERADAKAPRTGGRGKPAKRKPAGGKPTGGKPTKRTSAGGKSAGGDNPIAAMLGLGNDAPEGEEPAPQAPKVVAVRKRKRKA
jgi:hypothetical protein